MAQQGRLADVAQTGAKLRDLEPKSGTALCNAACAYVLPRSLVSQRQACSDPGPNRPMRRGLSLSLACLKEAIAAGYQNFKYMREDTDLAAIRNLPEFQKLFPPPAAK